MSNLHLCLNPPSPAGDASSIKQKKRIKRVANPNPNPNPNPSSTKADHTSIYRSNVVTPCSECGKQFGTWKALFGHMRCHPERQWRGMMSNKKIKSPKLLKQKQKQKKKEKEYCWFDSSNTNDHEVTRAALILMQMSSGRSFRERKVVKNLGIDLNLPPPVEEDLS